MVHLLTSEVQQLLHNKFVVILGDSIQRAVYKDLVLLLQKDCLLTPRQLKAKGEKNFENDELVDGGMLHNGIAYREVRQFRSSHHLVRFYFLTRVYSTYVEEILDELQLGEHTPDLVIMNSCLWDLSRYSANPWPSYLQNLESLFGCLRQVLPESCLLVWQTALPVGEKINSSCLQPPNQSCADTLKSGVVEANFYSSTAANKHGIDVLDLHFHFRHAKQHLQQDGVHWDEHAHRHLSQLLLAHVADAWGVELPHREPVGKWITDGLRPEGPDLGLEQLAAHRHQPGEPQHHPWPLPMHGPLLPPPPPQPLFHLPLPPQFPLQPHLSPFPPPMPLSLLCPQGPYFPSNHSFQPNQFFEFGSQPSMPHFHTRYYQHQAPVVYRGFPQLLPRGPYAHGQRQPRPFKRKARVYSKSRP